MLLEPKYTWNVDDYRDFCRQFGLVYPDDYSGIDEEEILMELEKLKDVYSCAFINDRDDGHFLIALYDLGDYIETTH